MARLSENFGRFKGYNPCGMKSGQRSPGGFSLPRVEVATGALQSSKS